MPSSRLALPSDQWREQAELLVPGLIPDQMEQFARFRDRILHVNKQFNLTAIRDADGIDFRLILESMRLFPYVLDAVRQYAGAVRLVDIGSGAGIPGIPLAILFPEIEIAMIEATAKKVDFIDATIRELSLLNASVVHGRSEELAHRPEWRETRQIATARAVGSIATLLELTMPFLRNQGIAIFPKGEIELAERNDGATAASILGSRLAEFEELTPIPGCPVTQLVLADKIESIADRYPRRPGLPAREPLGG